MKFLAVDPSTTRTGYAVYDGDRLLMSHSTTGGGGVRWHKLSNMADTLTAVAADYKVKRIVYETPSIQGTRNQAKKNLANVMTYIIGIGHLRGLLSDRTRLPIVDIPADDWTRRTPKPRRLRALTLRGIDYANGDEGDAILLGEWYAEREHQRSLESRIIGERRGGETVYVARAAK